VKATARGWWPGPSARWVWFGLATLLVLSLGMHRRELDGTTAFYAALSAQVADTGQLAPILHGDAPYVLKPPLLFWGTAALYEVFGVQPWTSTLLSRFFGWICVLLTARLAFLRYGPTAAWWAGFALVTTVPLLENAMTFRTDTALVAGILVSMVALAEPRGWWRPLAFYGGVTLATLSKGLPGLLPLGLAVVLGLLDGRFARPWSRAWVGWSVLLLPIPAWFVGIEIWLSNAVGQEILHDMIVGPRRDVWDVVTGSLDHVLWRPLERTPYWAPFAVLGAWVAWREWRSPVTSRTQRAWLVVLALWMVLVVAAAVAKPAQRVRYILPAAPVLAVWIGAWIGAHAGPRVQRLQSWLPAVMIAIVVVSWFAPDAWWPANHRTGPERALARSVVEAELTSDQRIVLVEVGPRPSGHLGRQWAGRDWTYLHLRREVEPVEVERLLDEPRWAGRLAVVHRRGAAGVPAALLRAEIVRTPFARLIRIPASPSWSVDQTRSR